MKKIIILFLFLTIYGCSHIKKINNPSYYCPNKFNNDYSAFYIGGGNIELYYINKNTIGIKNK